MQTELYCKKYKYENKNVKMKYGYKNNSYNFLKIKRD